MEVQTERSDKTVQQVDYEIHVIVKRVNRYPRWLKPSIEDVEGRIAKTGITQKENAIALAVKLAQLGENLDML